MLVDNQRQEESLHEAEESKTLGRQDPQVDELNELIERSYLKMNRIDEARLWHNSVETCSLPERGLAVASPTRDRYNIEPC